MKTVKQKYHVEAPVEKVWKSLIDPTEIDGWGGGPAVMDDKVGTEFSLWGGDIHGKNVEVLENKKLVQEWFGGEWDAPSIVTFVLKDRDGETDLELVQTDVPDAEATEIGEGWKDYYLGPLKEYAELS